MTTKIVLRLLDAENQLLGWSEHFAVARGDGKLWSQGTVTITAERAGDPVCVSLHWADVNVETRIPCPPAHVSAGRTIAIFAPHTPMVTLGIPPTNLPPVTVGSVAIGIEAGRLGVVGYR